MRRSTSNAARSARSSAGIQRSLSSTTSILVGNFLASTRKFIGRSFPALAVAPAAIRDEKTLSELAQLFDVHSHLDTAVEGAALGRGC
jgi:hypothetical protein